jgi:cation diffusion facilitator family transporter
MHQDNIQAFQHLHNFHRVKESNIRKVWLVVIITIITMMVEIVFGWITNSMALLSDGWHMGTHASALGITLFTYFIAKRHQKDNRYAFGTWKVEILGAYTSAILLGLVGLYVIYSSLERIIHPADIHYNQALLVAVIGLIINILCAFILNSKGHADHHHHHDDHGHHHHHDHSHDHDLNIKSAYLHVLADALTSVFAISALLGAKLLHLNILDPLIGILSSILIFRWAIQLLRDTSSILLDKDKNMDLMGWIKTLIESDDYTKISDLHLWRIGQNQYSCLLSVVASKPKSPQEYKSRLKDISDLAHINIEIVKCHSKGDNHEA